jgi:hypothetical protein
MITRNRQDPIILRITITTFPKREESNKYKISIPAIQAIKRSPISKKKSPTLYQRLKFNELPTTPKATTYCLKNTHSHSRTLTSFRWAINRSAKK